jgi:hypothetical protein
LADLPQIDERWLVVRDLAMNQFIANAKGFLYYESYPSPLSLVTSNEDGHARSNLLTPSLVCQTQ